MRPTNDNHRVNMVRHNDRAVDRYMIVVFRQTLQFSDRNKSKIGGAQVARNDSAKETLPVVCAHCDEIGTGRRVVPTLQTHGFS